MVTILLYAELPFEVKKKKPHYVASDNGLADMLTLASSIGLFLSRYLTNFWCVVCLCFKSKNQPQCRGEYNVYSTFQSHEPEFDYLKSLEIEEKINKIRWLPQKNAAQFLLSTNGQ